MGISNQKVYWRGLEELTNDLEFVKNADKEFNLEETNSTPESHNFSLDGSKRRDFLKVMGFSVAAVSLAACEAPVRNAIPFLNKPEEYDPSIANYYASSFIEGGDYCSILVKTREGRPIKIEGNKLSSITKGGTSPRAQASVLSLYDNNRFKAPSIDGKDASWNEIDEAIKTGLAGGIVYLVSGTVFSPTAKKAIDAFLAKYPGSKHVMYDANSVSGLLNANQESFGNRAIPSYKFEKAKTVVTFGADFLGTWILPLEYSRAFAATRRVGKNKKEMSRMYAVESLMSITGANADYRLSIKASEEGDYLLALYNAVAIQLGKIPVGQSSVTNKLIEQMAKDLVASQGASIVVSGSNDKSIQVIVNSLNTLLGNYGSTIDWSEPVKVKQGSDEQMNAFVDALKGGQVGAAIMLDANPVYDHPRGEEIKAGLKSIATSVALTYAPDETAAACKFVAASHHQLESWGDAEPKSGYYSLIQPSISPLFKTRQAEESLLVWAGVTQPYYEFLKENWKSGIYPSQKFGYRSFQDFWNYSLHDGVFEVNGKNPRQDTATNDSTSAPAPPLSSVKLPFIETALTSAVSQLSTSKKGEGLELVVYEKQSLGTGVQANNPWLQEMPDPVTRACWENYVTLPVDLAKSLGIKVNEGKTGLVTLTVGGKSIDIPALVQPGQNKNTVGLAMGYGREVTGKTGKGIGKNAFKLLGFEDNTIRYSISGVKVAAKNEVYNVAHVQTHHTVMHRPVIQEAKLSEYQKNEAAGRYFPTISSLEKGQIPANEVSLWYDKKEEAKPNPEAVGPNKRPNHAWGMVIDLNTCFGCGACVVACQAENNVQVVGKQEVLNRREMHWIRIDRYYSTDASEKDLAGSEIPSDNPEVVFQPVMCQHCNNAPCETVCPVAATTHSTEGLNQMAYNRCIGTRYCANNCPYKVRRFNWFSYPQNDKFDYHFNNDLGRMVINPDVTVRARGVIEKCSMCVQRIQEGKLFAKKEGRRPIDGEIQTACAQACPTEAITFGDMLDPQSKISNLLEEHGKGRNYTMLEEISTRPSVSYLTKIRNKA